MNKKQVEAVLALSGAERVAHFVKVVADREEAWGLYDGGWASSGTDDGATAFPLWPRREYAQLCATDGWSTYKPQAIVLEDLLGSLLPMLVEQSALVAVFQTPSNRGVTMTPDQLQAMLSCELERY